MGCSGVLDDKHRERRVTAALESKRCTAKYAARVADSRSAARDLGPRGRCVCGEKVTIADAHEITLPNGRAGWQGYCPECGAPLFAIRRGAQARSSQKSGRPRADCCGGERWCDEPLGNPGG